MDLQRRYAKHVAFPGKAALFMRRLAVKYQQAEISRSAVLREFHLQSGLSLSFLDTRSKLERQDIIGPLQSQIIGQQAALDAATDVISIAKARLNDPDRPLGTLLFLGPTGVGKTQCAKAIAAFLFGDAEKLVRFDMNEFVVQGSAARRSAPFGNRKDC
jgi:ATP-dependent Clp protease ATP-binding subunit ClpA